MTTACDLSTLAADPAPGPALATSADVVAATDAAAGDLIQSSPTRHLDR